MDDAIALLTNENRRLNTIINALAEKLQATEDLLSAYQKEKACMPNDDNDRLRIKIGAPNNYNAMLTNKVGIPNDSNDRLTNKTGMPNDNNAMPTNKIDTPNNSNAMLRNKVGISTINIPMLMNELKVVMKTCPEPSLLNTAKLLVHVYCNPKNSISDFRKVCSLSADGMAKNIRAMARRHLITKVSFQRYTLTEMAIKMLERSATVNSEQ